MKFIDDSYRLARGNQSRMLLISCEKCGSFLFHYQKDGPGPLKRCYIDRVFEKNNYIIANGLAICEACRFPFGLYTIYEKEGRPAIRLFVESVKKKTVPLRVI